MRQYHETSCGTRLVLILWNLHVIARCRPASTPAMLPTHLCLCKLTAVNCLSLSLSIYIYIYLSLSLSLCSLLSALCSLLPALYIYLSARSLSLSLSTFFSLFAVSLSLFLSRSLSLSALYIYIYLSIYLSLSLSLCLSLSLSLCSPFSFCSPSLSISRSLSLSLFFLSVSLSLFPSRFCIFLFSFLCRLILQNPSLYSVTRVVDPTSETSCKHWHPFLRVHVGAPAVDQEPELSPWHSLQWTMGHWGWARTPPPSKPAPRPIAMLPNQPSLSSAADLSGGQQCCKPLSWHALLLRQRSWMPSILGGSYGVGVDGIGVIFPFFNAFFPFFTHFSPFSSLFSASPKGQGQTTAIYCNNGEFHSDSCKQIFLWILGQRGWGTFVPVLGSFMDERGQYVGLKSTANSGAFVQDRWPHP